MIRNIFAAIVVGGALILGGIDAKAADVVVSGRAFSGDGVLANLNGATALLNLTNTTITSTASTPMSIDQSADMGVWVTSQAAAAGVSNNIIGIDVSPDTTGTNFSTSTPITLTWPNNGTNIVTAYFVIMKTNWVGAAQIRWDMTSTTSASKVTILNVQTRYITTPTQTP